MKTRTSRQGEPSDRSWLSKNQKPIIAILLALVAALAPYTGYKEYKEYKAEKPSVSVTIEAPKDNGPVVEILSRLEIEGLIDKAIKARHEKNLKLFKQKEAWEQ